MIDGLRFKAARFQLGLSAAEVAERARVTQAIIHGIECGSTGQITLEQAGRAADAVALSLSDLISRPTTPGVDGPGCEENDADLAATVGTTLFRARSTVAWADLSSTLGRSAAEVRAAVRTLEPSMARAGLNIHTTSGYAVLVARDPGPSARVLRQLERRRRSRQGINLSQARLLWRIAFAPSGRRLYGVETPSVKAVVGSLINAGLVENAKSGKRLELSGSVRFALDAGDVPKAASWREGAHPRTPDAVTALLTA